MYLLAVVACSPVLDSDTKDTASAADVDLDTEVDGPECVMVGYGDDNDRDGEVDYTSTFAYDYAGRVIAETWDNGRTFRYTWDDEGRLLSESDGFRVWLAYQYTYAYDAAGKLVLATYDDHGADDGDGADGVPEEYRAYMYDADGLLIRQERSNGDGVVWARVSYSWDPEGRLLSRQSLDGDGEPQGTYTWEYDRDGNLLIADYDRENSPPRPDTRKTYTWDDDGRLRTFAEDYDGDGVIDLRETSMWSADGQELTIDHDKYDDGIVDYRDTYRYSDVGLVTEYEIDDLTDEYPRGPHDYREVYSYDANGRMSSRYVDNGANGFDQRVLVTHDSGGRELVWDYYSDVDGDTWKGGWVRTSTWDCDWRE